ncbi:ABC transporter substrate-binding protein [Desulfosarcina cetonica]
MPFKRPHFRFWSHLPLTLRLGVIFISWLLVITYLHVRMNHAPDARQMVRMGYMPVVTNLAAPLIDHVTRNHPDIRFEAVKFTSFAEMAEALRNDAIQAAFIIAPLAVVLRQQGVDVKVVMIGNRHESTLVARKTLHAKRLEDLVGHTIAVPMRYSGHNLCLLKTLEAKGLAGRIQIVEMNPPDMAAALAAGGLDAYFVGEPFAVQSVKSGVANVIDYVETLWPDFICNLILVKNSWIADHPMLAQQFVSAAARSGLWAGGHPKQAARIAADYWNQPVEWVESALTIPPQRIVYDRFVPHESEMQEIADMMARYHLIAHADIAGLVEDQLARNVSSAGIDGIDSVLRP